MNLDFVLLPKKAFGKICRSPATVYSGQSTKTRNLIPLRSCKSTPSESDVNQVEDLGVLGEDQGEYTSATHVAAPRRQKRNFLSILSIKCGNWFYWADRAERAERAESKESPEFMRI
jgi:hypothetical protein